MRVEQRVIPSRLEVMTLEPLVVEINDVAVANVEEKPGHAVMYARADQLSRRFAGSRMSIRRAKPELLAEFVLNLLTAVADFIHGGADLAGSSASLSGLVLDVVVLAAGDLRAVLGSAAGCFLAGHGFLLCLGP